nr:RDD family protein [Lysinibacillus timonensis]
MTFRNDQGRQKNLQESLEVTTTGKISTTEQMKYVQKTAGFWMRLWAFIIDSLIVTAIIGIVVNPIFHLGSWNLNDTNMLAPISIISAIFYYSYFVLMTKYFQQTLGKMIFGLKILSINDSKISWGTVFFREFIGRFISNKLPILYLLVIFMPKNNSIADYFSDTVVVHENAYIKIESEVNTPLINAQQTITPT